MTPDLLHKRGGFTVIELVVIIVMIGILAAMVLPRLHNPSGFRIRGYSDELISATRYAQKLAMASGCEARITINTGDFALHQRCDVGTWQPAALPGTSPPYTAPFDVTSSSATIIFFGSGKADSSPSVSVNTIPALRVHGATGYVERL